MTQPTQSLWWRVFAPFAAGYFFSYLLRNANAVIAPALGSELGLAATDLGLLTSAYLAAFGLAQLPLGLLMDRFGPRRVEAVLLVIAAAGCAVFALGESRNALLVGRAMIGLGVSACLMASFATFARQFGSERQASLNAAVMAAGATGALMASQPLAWASGLAGWRPLFLALGVTALLVAAAIWSSPEKVVARGNTSVRRQIAQLGDIFRSRAFWVFAPQGSVLIGGFMALQGLWAVPFMMQVDNLSRELAAGRLSVAAMGMLLGFLAVAVGIQPLKRRGIAPEAVLAVSLGLGLAALAAIVLGVPGGALLWGVLGFSFSANNLSYACLQQRYPLELAGRVNTALNLLVFVGAFIIQWGFGFAVDSLQAAGWAATDAYRASFATLALLQATAWLWYVVRIRQADAV